MGVFHVFVLIFFCCSLIGPLLLGYIEADKSDDNDDEARTYLPKQNDNQGFSLPAPRAPKTVPALLSTDDNDEENNEDKQLF
mmetsp:Transcript_25318/g.58877  ORF Transcript_25318/g.58877 Transcript_25318/m.58877 type:complete len:82 (+) Transcript_25318:571-816(+)